MLWNLVFAYLGAVWIFIGFFTMRAASRPRTSSAAIWYFSAVVVWLVSPALLLIECGAAITRGFQDAFRHPRS